MARTDAKTHDRRAPAAEPEAAYTPMFAQYFGMKREYPEAILLARVGDFYEAYGEDAETIARALQIALTAKEGGGGRRVAMAGVPHHALEPHLAKLVAQRYVVALADQLEPPQPNRLVKRAVTRVVTPGTLFEERLLDGARNNYLAAVAEQGGRYALVYADVSTGESAATVFAGEAALADLLAELHRVAPVEIVAAIHLHAPLETLATQLQARVVEGGELEGGADAPRLDGFSAEEAALVDRASRRLTRYVRRVGLAGAAPLRPPVAYRREAFVGLDPSTRRHLELTRPLGANPKATLLATLDATRTAMGSRLLARWILAPLLDRAAIEARQTAVARLLERYDERAELAERLDALYDIERIAQKVRLRRALPRDLGSLRRTLEALAPLKATLAGRLPEAAARVADFSTLLEELRSTLHDDPPAAAGEGGVVRPEADEALARALDLKVSGREALLALEERERRRTGIKSLKIKYAGAFGYGIEVPRLHASPLPEEWIRRQTLTNAERYTTPELKALEAEIASAGAQATRLEQDLFAALVERVALDVDALLAAAEAVAEVDVLVAFAQLAGERGYARPAFVEGSEIAIVDGRHPVVEALRGEGFVPNDLRLLERRERFLLLTGPNMGGKSTYLRQTALLTIMAQIGSFVPAKSMRLGVVDRIFTRIGAGDDLASGQSTFYLEMAETAQILARATRRSLVLVDEVGRGTGTSDGLSIAQAICEHLIELDADAPMTLFATHFHELVALADLSPLVANYHVTAVERQDASGEPVFSHRVLPGSTSRSFGIEVARMAGLPASVVRRAARIAEALAGHAPPAREAPSREVPSREARRSVARPEPPADQLPLSW